MGEEAWKAHQRSITRKHRERTEGRAPYDEAYRAALHRLRDLHADHFLKVLNEERYKRGLDPKN